jgi:hypothetical protein
MEEKENFGGLALEVTSVIFTSLFVSQFNKCVNPMVNIHWGWSWSLSPTLYHGHANLFLYESVLWCNHEGRGCCSHNNCSYFIGLFTYTQWMLFYFQKQERCSEFSNCMDFRKQEEWDWLQTLLQCLLTLGNSGVCSEREVILFWEVGGWTQGLTIAKQVPYHLSLKGLF